MAPYPDSSTPTDASEPEVVQTAPAEDSALPGMKRGIAIGVACSVGILVIALLAFFAYRRRKQQATKARHSKLSPQEPVEMDAPGGFWPQEKAQHVQKVPIEADAHVVHELDGSCLPELPGHYEGQELANKKTPRTSYYAGDEDAFGAQMQHWNQWDAALNAVPQPTQEPTRNSSPYQELPPVRTTTNLSATPDMTFYSPSHNASFSVSPIAPSPLENAHFSPPSTGQTRQQRYYDQARGST
ncbi:hypothetical protein E8E13_009664 [Curvularia kusanoi]|uniref:Uncharacterized protein n=1 Tax=Curvularia kusanoi TaxID=90978 RepID=A0A9P4TNJ4_CURKU|nr:hypothetical protein E8E13_009664 [Curvularia kusanoi]